MPLNLTRIRYDDLTGKQKEYYNFQKVSAALADFGFMTQWLTYDRDFTDFIAKHVDGNTTLRVQLERRLAFRKKYLGKDLYIAFREGETCYLYRHDELLERVLRETNISNTRSWQIDGGYDFPRLSDDMAALLEPYRISGPGL